MISIRQMCPMASRRAFVQCACQRASFEPREPITSCSVSKPENLSDNGNNGLALGAGGLLAQLRNRAVRDLIDNSLGEQIKRFFLFRGQRTEFLAEARDLRGPNLL